MAAAVLALAGCVAGSADDEDRGDGDGTSQGFAADATIGVTLPDEASPHWALVGDLFEEGLAEAGFSPEVQYAGGSVEEQQKQIDAMVQGGAEAVLVAPVDASQLTAQTDAAAAADTTVLAFENLLRDTGSVGYFVTFDSYEAGRLQGQALLDGMAARFPDKETYSVELFAGPLEDGNAGLFWQGAMDLLQAKIDDGTIAVASGQTDMTAAAIAGWAADGARSRMDALLGAHYAEAELDGVLSPNDAFARAILESARAAGKPLPVVTGLDSEADSVRSIVAGEQYMTLYRDTRALVTEAIAMVEAMQQGEEPEVDDAERYDNGVMVVPTRLVPPVVVTKENAAEVYKDEPELAALAG